MATDARLSPAPPPDAIGLGVEQIDPDEPALVEAFVAFLKEASARRSPDGVMRRFNQGRATACVRGAFVVPDDLAPDLRVGLFARPGRYEARIRFANASSSSDRERDIRGMAIAVRGVDGANLTDGSTEQHFVLNSHPVMMVGTTREFLDLLRANDAGGLTRVLYFLRHLRAVNIAREAQQQPSCHLDIPYWSAVPYRFGGAGTAVKYAVHPTSQRRSGRPQGLTDDYLRVALREHLASAEASFDLSVQFQADPVRTPIEDASIEWKATLSPFRRVGRLVIPPQELDPADEAACEAAAFSPWHCLPEHQPIGGMNRARREIYRQMAAFRAAHADARRSPDA